MAKRKCVRFKPKPKRKQPRYVFVEWRDRGDYHGGSYTESDVPALLGTLAERGVSSVVIDEVEVCVPKAK
jgi:hypothetical protein